MDDFIEKLKNKFKDTDELINLLMTFMGTHMLVNDFITKNVEFSNIPSQILYAITVSSANVDALIADEPVDSCVDLQERSPYKMSEQTQETIHRNAKEIITEIYNSFNRNEINL